MCIQIQFEANEFILSDEQSNIYVESVKRYLKINEFVRNKNGSARICLDSYKPLTKELLGSKTTLWQNIDSDNLHMYDCVSSFLACNVRDLWSITCFKNCSWNLLWILVVISTASFHYPKLYHIWQCCLFINRRFYTLFLDKYFHMDKCLLFSYVQVVRKAIISSWWRFRW